MNTKITAKALTEAEKLQDRIERYEARAAENRAKAARLKAKVSEEKRKIDTRKKIVLGAAVQHVLKSMNAADFAVLRAHLTKHISTKDLEIDGLLDMKREIE